jgi:hypothetical protein
MRRPRNPQNGPICTLNAHKKSYRLSITRYENTTARLVLLAFHQVQGS